MSVIESKQHALEEKMM
jgi:hypothetical protein